MTDSRLYQITAVVLRSRDYGEGHRLITLFSREEGKVLAIARGVKKPKAKLAASLQHFTIGDIQLAKGRRFDVITQVRVRNPLYGLRTSLEAVAYASYFAELFDVSLEERQQQTALYDLLIDALERLARGDTTDMLARYVEISLIAMLGYLPQLSTCAHCQRPLMEHNAEGRAIWPEWLGFSSSHGGALCPICMTSVPGAKRVAAGTVQVARLLLAKGISALDGLELSDRLRREIETVFRDYLEYRLEHHLQSARFLHDWGDEAAEDTPSTSRIMVAGTQ